MYLIRYNNIMYEKITPSFVHTENVNINARARPVFSVIPKNKNV